MFITFILLRFFENHLSLSSYCQSTYSFHSFIFLFFLGAALIPFLGKKLEKNDVSEEASKLECFKREADTLYSVYLIENAYNVLRRSY